MTGIQLIALLISLAALAFSVYGAYRVGIYRAENNKHAKRLDHALNQGMTLRLNDTNPSEVSETPTNECRCPRGPETK
jgi:uncharacterized lipoprotein YmbA